MTDDVAGLANGYAQGVIRPGRETAADILVGMMTSALDAFAGAISRGSTPGFR